MSEKITFRELVELIAEQSKQSQTSTNSFIGELVNIIESGLRQSGSVSISGFGKFELRWMNERPGVNPQTGEEITIPGQNKVVFKPYKALREDVNRPYAKMEPQILDESPDDSSGKDESGVNQISDEDSPSAKASSEDGDDFLIERPNPSKDKSVADTSDTKADQKSLGSEIEPEDKEEEKKSKQEKVTPIPIRTGSQTSEKKDTVKSKLPANQKTPALTPGQRKNLSKKVQDSGNFNWTYAAAAVIVALAIFIIFLLSRQVTTNDSPELASQPEQITAPVTPEQDRSVEESEPPPVENESESEPTTETEPYFVDQGESLWSIAEGELGNPYLWPMIYGLNLDEVENPNIIPASAELTVPVISDPDNLSESQLEQVAEGYLSVYQWTKANNPDEAKYFLWAVGVFSPDKLDLAASSVDQADLTFAKTR
jgi:nucleoid DNA-binding protein